MSTLWITKEFNTVPSLALRVRRNWHTKKTGVVLNEMEGARADAELQAYFLTMHTLFGDTCLRHDSGGLPSEIPSPTYEAFCREYAARYHPSNALFVATGNHSRAGVLSPGFDPPLL